METLALFIMTFTVGVGAYLGIESYVFVRKELNKRREK